MSKSTWASFGAGFLLATVIVLAVLSESSCYDPHAQESRIVREVEAAGAGNISTYTVPGLVQWFSSRPDLARTVAGQCAPLERAAGANWGTSAEGSVCYAAAKMVPSPAMVADQRTW